MKSARNARRSEMLCAKKLRLIAAQGPGRPRHQMGNPDKALGPATRNFNNWSRRQNMIGDRRHDMIGDKMPDGTVYAGISPDTGKAMYARPEDESGSYSFNEAAK